MKRTIFSLLSILPLAGTLVAGAQAPPAAPIAPPMNTSSETGKVSRIIAGPGDRPQGLLLRNGTFVNFSPSLVQQLPSSLAKNSSVRVSGDVLTYKGERTIEAHAITIAGVAYNETLGAPPVAPGAAPAPPPLPPPAAGGPAGPPPPPPCAAGAPPPPPPPGAGRRVPPPNGVVAPAPPPAGDAVPMTPPPAPPQDGAAPPAIPPGR